MSGESKNKNILITGADGFIGKNLCVFLKQNGYDNIYKVTLDTTEDKLSDYLKETDFIFNLAGVNRPKNNDEFRIGNADFLESLIEKIKSLKKTIPIMLSSSTQAVLDNPYGKSKLQAENILKKYSKDTGADIYIYRFSNVFGKWSKPDYNSAVATFCYNISRNIPIKVNDSCAKLDLMYIDDVCAELLSICNGNEQNDIKLYSTTVGEVANVIKSFYDTRNNFYVPNLEGLNKYLYSTYLSFLDPKNFSYPLVMHKDERGSFTEILKTLNDGQFSVNIIKPSITKGGHYHNTKNEKFVVVAGKVLIEFVSMEPDGNKENIMLEVSSNDMTVVDIPCGYSHTIKNIGEEDAVVIMWLNEVFDEAKSDTYVI